MSGLGELIEEPPGGPNHGSRAHEGHEAVHVVSQFGGRRDGRYMQPLGAPEWQAAEFMRSGGWVVADVSRGSGGVTPGARDAGMSAHRGVLHSDEYVSAAALQYLVERELGFTYDEIRSVYRQGRLSDAQRELRARIDARILALSKAGGNIALLGRALGFRVGSDSHCEALDNALARARAGGSS